MTTRNHIASRYLETLSLEDNKGPLRPVKLNQPIELTPSKLNREYSTKSSHFEAATPRTLEINKDTLLTPIVTNSIEKSIAGLKLDSPSPLKRTSKPKTYLNDTAPPKFNLNKNQKGYEYLCRVGEVKEWIESIIQEEVPSIIELSNDSLRDGVILAKLTQVIKPELVKRIFPSGSKLQFKHTENINLFFQLVDYVKMPDLFRFELTDLYDKRSIPKVIFCLHALSFMLSQDSRIPLMQNLSGKLNFTDQETKKSEQSLVGMSLPNFESMHKQFKRELPAVSPITTLAESKPQVRSTSPPQTRENPFLKRDLTISEPTLKQPSYNDTPDSTDFEDVLVQRYNSSPSKKKQKLTESEYSKNIIKFQSIARGSIFRYSMFVDRIILKSMSDNIIQLQAIARRSLVTNKFRLKSSTIQELEPELVQFQSIIRATRERSKIKEINDSQPDDKIQELQKISRGSLIRSQIGETDRQLNRYDHKIVKLQSKIRSTLAVDRIEKSAIAHEPITNFQSQVRRVLFERKAKKSANEAYSSEDVILIIQSVIRASALRSSLMKKKRIILEQLEVITDLQSVGRGGLIRSRLNKALDVIDFQELKINQLVAIFKGNKLRSKVQHQRKLLERYSSSVIKVQSSVRGVLSRFDYDLFMDSIDYYSFETTGLQASIRGYLYRQSKRDVMRYYEGHLQAIIKIQSFIRGKYLGSAYKSLISIPSPPLSVIKRFAYLLNDSDVDFEEEVQLTRIKESISEKTNSNELLEKHISQLDLKIALLQKNRITLDELLIQKNQHVGVDHSSTINVSSLNRRAKTRMELYEKLFYLLQTQPIYLSRLILKSYRGVDVAFKIFSNLQIKELPTREEYMFIRLIDNTLHDSISKSQCVDDLQKHSRLGWQRLLKSFNETQAKTLSNLFGPLLESIITDSQLSFESDPVVIYKHTHNTPKTLPVDKAIEDPETKAAFVFNLQQLREFGSEVFRIINDNVDKIPNHIKVLANTAYKTSQRKFPYNLEQEHLANAGFVLIDGFIGSILENPELALNFSAIEESEVYGKNLQKLSKLLIQLFSMKPFGSDDVYMKPLNKFISSSVEGVRSLLKSIIEVGEIDSLYNMSVYDDMTAHNRPKLTLRISDMVSIEKLIKDEIDSIAPLEDDTLREIMVDIQSNNASDIFKLQGHYTLSLNPSSYKSSPDDTRVKALFMQAKRCVLYLIQVQDDEDDFYELLKSKIDPIHEIKFKQIINTENQNIEKNNVNDYINDGQGFLGNLNNITYHKLKQLALERILELESIGRVSRNDSFQILLNEMAYDIRTKHDQRISRKKQLRIAENTLIRLGEKHKFLEEQLHAYNIHIDKSMLELQSKPSKNKRIMPFTKQFFYERELKKSGNIPKFGAYKYSSKRLYEKGILISLRGLNQEDSLNSHSSSFFGGMSFPKIDFMFNCNKPGVFAISSKSGTFAVNGSLETLTIDQLLEYQFENKPQIELFNGMAKFDTNCLINFIFKKFYHFDEGSK